MKAGLESGRARGWAGLSARCVAGPPGCLQRTSAPAPRRRAGMQAPFTAILTQRSGPCQAHMLRPARQAGQALAIHLHSAERQVPMDASRGRACGLTTVQAGVGATERASAHRAQVAGWLCMPPTAAALAGPLLAGGRGRSRPQPLAQGWRDENLSTSRRYGPRSRCSCANGLPNRRLGVWRRRPYRCYRCTLPSFQLLPYHYCRRKPYSTPLSAK